MKLASITATTLFILLVFILLAEWLAGCGESYVDAYGVRHQNECIIIPSP
jgi:hypothetical protein